MRAMRTADCTAGQSENESDSVLLERRWFAAHKAAQAMRVECEILREVMDTAQANWRDAMARLANLDALCDALEEQYVSFIEHSHPTLPAPHVGEMTAA
jgi:hypothetical protein